MRYYTLDEKYKAVPVKDVLEWARWFETHDRVVRQDLLKHILVSTVFLGLDHSYGFAAKPLLFETIAFGIESNEFGARYSTWDEALEGHYRILEEVRNQLPEVYLWKEEAVSGEEGHREFIGETDLVELAEKYGAVCAILVYVNSDGDLQVETVVAPDQPHFRTMVPQILRDAVALVSKRTHLEN